jgi:predicted RNA-binding protein YlqC (UPF0109 family)
MKELLTYILSEITGGNNFEVEEIQGENGFLTLKVITDPKYMGLIIGKQGRTINSIRNILKVKATLDRIGFSLEVVEK